MLSALALAACAAPLAAPTALPTVPATLAALPPTAVPAPYSTLAPAVNVPVPATSVSLPQPYGVVFDAAGNMYISACGFVPKVGIFKVDPHGLLSLYAGDGNFGIAGEGGPARAAEFGCPQGMAFDAGGDLYVADASNNLVRRIDRATSIITTMAGSVAAVYEPPAFAGDGGPATAARLNRPTDLAFDASGNLYISDSLNNRVRKVDRQGLISTVAGNGEQSFSGDGGPATAAALYQPQGLAITADGNLYIADGGNARVRKVNVQGTITTVAGDGGPNFGGDGGPATAATLSNPIGVAFDATGNLYISAGYNAHGIHYPITVKDNRIRRVDPQGIITTVAGAGPASYSGDGGPAQAANIWAAASLSFNPQGNLVFVDSGNDRVRKVDEHGIITTIAGGVP
jgi:sugar lactone lactonase YvrE